MLANKICLSSCGYTLSEFFPVHARKISLERLESHTQHPLIIQTKLIRYFHVLFLPFERCGWIGRFGPPCVSNMLVLQPQLYPPTSHECDVCVEMF